MSHDPIEAAWDSGYDSGYALGKAHALEQVFAEYEQFDAEMKRRRWTNVRNGAWRFMDFLTKQLYSGV